MTRDEVSNISPEAHAYCLEQFDKFKTLGPFTPFSIKEPRLTFPSSMGGADWAGVSYDPKLGYIFANASNLGQTGQMAPSPPGSPMPFCNQGAYARFVDKQGYPCNQPPWENSPPSTLIPATWSGVFRWDRMTRLRRKGLRTWEQLTWAASDRRRSAVHRGHRGR
jgi:hypothetical protein